MIIFNEKEHAMKMIDNGFITPNQEIKDLFILSKYLYYIGYGEKEVSNKIDEFIMEHKKEYCENVRNKIVSKTTISAKKGKLLFDKTIYIYESEIKAIELLEDDKLKRLMFCYIVLSKFYNGLFKVSRADLFRLARLEVHNRDKPKLIYELNKTKNTITTIKKGKTLRGIDIKPQGNVVMTFVVDEDFILHYLKYTDDEKVINCKICGKLIYKSNNKQIYCSTCSKEIRKEKVKENVKRFRKRKCNQIEKPKNLVKSTAERCCGLKG